MKASKIVAVAALLLAAGGAVADGFGTDGNQFTIGFVTISGSTNPTSGIPAGGGFAFTGVINDYRIGVYEIANGQWDKFKASLGVPVTGEPYYAYDSDPYFTGTNIPTNNVSWYEAAQFVNWLNTSTDHHAAYKFTGTQGQSDYALATWDASKADNGTNLYRHKDAFYYLPTEDEWVKAAYWNGTDLQEYATKPGEVLYQGNGANGGWNYHVSGDYGPAGPYDGPWEVGSGSEELNGTFDMMGNISERVESPYFFNSYADGADRPLRGGTYGSDEGYLASSTRLGYSPVYEYRFYGFRVASDVPAPATLALLAFGSLAVIRRRRS